MLVAMRTPEACGSELIREAVSDDRRVSDVPANRERIRSHRFFLSHRKKRRERD
jgi:hypothetical protein